MIGIIKDSLESCPGCDEFSFAGIQCIQYVYTAPRRQRRHAMNYSIHQRALLAYLTAPYQICTQYCEAVQHSTVRQYIHISWGQADDVLYAFEDFFANKIALSLFLNERKNELSNFTAI